MRANGNPVTGTRIHNIWMGMNKRCRESRGHNFEFYKGRGIAVCAEWVGDFTAFQTWALAHGYADHLEIDRIDSDKGYEPDNCRWATRSQQVRNRRKTTHPCSSRYKGVCWDTSQDMWKVQIYVNGRRTYCGLFDDEEAAARHYDTVATREYGEYARLNFRQG